MNSNADESEIVMISALNQFVFCPRRCALMHVEGIWADNEHTALGSLLHEHADEPGYESGEGATVLRALPLYSVRYGLAGKADLVELRPDRFGNDVPAPVEFKKGKRRRFDNDDIQLCAQALCLEEMFATEVPVGFVYHAATRRRREVIFDWRLRMETEKTINAVRDLLRSAEVPAAELKPRCDGCSLRGVCLPELTALNTEQGDYRRQIWAE